MAKEVSQTSIPFLFNSPLETGVRSLFVLDAAYPRSFDLTELTWLDHLVVHSGDVGGPPSLHPDLPHRTGELLIRRELIRDGLTLMRRQHLINMHSASRGQVYSASDDGVAIVEHMRTEYARTLRDRARWLADITTNLSPEGLRNLVHTRLGRWDLEIGAAGALEAP